MILATMMSPSLVQAQARWEMDWLHRLADHRTAGKNAFFQTISDVNVPLTLGVPIGWLAYGLLDKNASATREGITWTAAQLVNGALTLSMKAAVNRPRPAVSDPTLIALEDVRIHSFPSGHTSSAASTESSLKKSQQTQVKLVFFKLIPTFLSIAAKRGVVSFHLQVFLEDVS